MNTMIRSNQKGIALILSLFISVLFIAFTALAFKGFLSNATLGRRYETSLPVLYTLEAARVACMWEEHHAALYNMWDTNVRVGGAEVVWNLQDTNNNPVAINSDAFDSICRLQGAIITPARQLQPNLPLKSVYTLAGFNFEAFAVVLSGDVRVYAQAHPDQLPNPLVQTPQYTKYMEYIHSPNPMYRYMMFSNTPLTFSGPLLYEVNGGRIYANGYIEFKPSGIGIRFSKLGLLSATGTIRYAQRSYYPAPHLADELDGVKDARAPAPYVVTGQYTSTTKGEDVLPGPFPTIIPKSRVFLFLLWILLRYFLIL